jgi:predicted DNA-binding protein (MmcQ/YjbR family)
MAATDRLGRVLLKHALSMPEAYEDHPWGETVVKVNKKIFVFLGMEVGAGIGLKLPVSGHFALQHAYAVPTGYGMGKHGWVSINLTAEDRPQQGLLLEWIEESYRAIAPKKLGTRLERSS